MVYYFMVQQIQLLRQAHLINIVNQIEN